MDTKKRLQVIEDEITRLTLKRKDLFNEWAYIVKKNERIFDLDGTYNNGLSQRADELLKEQKAIGRKVMRLLEKADNLILD